MNADAKPPVVIEAGGPLLDIEAARRRAPEGFWPKLLRVMGRIPFAEEIAAAWFCARDPATPARVKLVIYGALAYFVTPADMAPDFIAGLGFADDAAVLTTALGVVGLHLRPRHWRAARARLGLPARRDEG